MDGLLLIEFIVISIICASFYSDIIITYGLEGKKGQGSSRKDTPRAGLTQKYSARKIYKRQLDHPDQPRRHPNVFLSLLRYIYNLTSEAKPTTKEKVYINQLVR